MNTDEAVKFIRPLAEVEREHVLLALNLSGGDKVKAAKALGISTKGLYLKLNRYAEQEDAAS